MIERVLWAPCRQERGARPFGEYRFINGSKVESHFVSLEDRSPLPPNFPEGYNIYFGVLPRNSKSGKDPVDHTHFLWADFDDREGFLFKAMGRFKVQPDIVVDSGRGFQTYWRLAEPMPHDLARIVMKGIAKFHDGDHVYDAPRILRVDGTVNQKNGAVARVIRDQPADHSWSEFIDYAEEGRDKPRSRFLPKEGELVSLSSLPQWLTDRMSQAYPKGSRSEAAFGVVCSLTEMGFTLDQIVDLFEDYPYGVGEKYFEKGRNGYQWLKTTFENALRKQR